MNDSKQAEVDPALARLEQLTESDFPNGAPQLCRELVRYAVEVRQEGQVTEAASYTKRALELFDRMDASLRKRHRGAYAWALSVHGALLTDSGRVDEGGSYLASALAVYGDMDPVDPLLWDGHRAQTLRGTAIFYAKRQDFPQALKYARDAVAAASAFGENAPQDLVAVRSAALVTQARLLSVLGQSGDALTALEDAAGGFNVMAAQSSDSGLDLAQLGMDLTESVDDMALPQLASVFVMFAGTFAREHHRDIASRFAERAVRLLRMVPQTGETRCRLAGALNNSASLLDEVGDRRAAIDRGREGCQLAERCVADGVPGAAPVLWQCTFNLAATLLNDGQTAEAERIADDALRRVNSASADEAPWAAELRKVSELAKARQGR